MAERKLPAPEQTPENRAWLDAAREGFPQAGVVVERAPQREECSGRLEGQPFAVVRVPQGALQVLRERFVTFEGGERRRHALGGVALEVGLQRLAASGFGELLFEVSAGELGRRPRVGASL